MRLVCVVTESRQDAHTVVVVQS